MRTMSRFEFKYALHPSTYHRVLAQIQAHMRPDRFTAKPGGYWVRSLYWDDARYSAYWEKVHGDSQRCKLRIRAYSCHREETAYVSLELKTKLGERTEKFTSFVYEPLPVRGPMDWHRYFAQLRDSDNPVTQEFLRRVYTRHLFPNLLVQYFRAGFEARDGGDLRLTFDRKTASTASKELFPEICRFRPHGPAILLEIKTGTNVPVWLRQLIQQNGLTVQKNSKYAQAVENCAPNVIHQI